jgi:hypothetical protein
MAKIHRTQLDRDAQVADLADARLGPCGSDPLLSDAIASFSNLASTKSMPDLDEMRAGAAGAAKILTGIRDELGNVKLSEALAALRERKFPLDKVATWIDGWNGMQLGVLSSLQDGYPEVVDIDGNEER